jgi:hypothetical protein
MAHPYHEHMDHKKQKSRVSHIAHHYAHGGAVHGDEKEDKALIRKEVKSSALKHEHKTHKADGGAVAPRQDKVARRARGGKVGHKGKGHTSVNVIVAPQQGAGGGGMVPHPAMAGPAPAPAGPPPGAVPPGGGMPPGAMAGRPPMPPGGGMPPPGMMPPRAHGGRTYARGGAIKSGPAWHEGVRNGTQPMNLPNKGDRKDMGRGRVITYKKGGRIGDGPHFDGGAGGGRARLEKPEKYRKANRR